MELLGTQVIQYVKNAEKQNSKNVDQLGKERGSLVRETAET